MESINPPSDNQTQLAVLPLGFEEAVMEKLKSIFQLSQTTERHYMLASSANNSVAIVLVNYDNMSAVQEKNSVLAQCPQAQLVGFSHGLVENPPEHHVRGMLTAVRLLSLFDKLPTVGSNTEVSAKKINNGYRALIVDDSLAIQKSIELHLRELPQITTIEFADDGETALAKIAKDYYDLIFLDIMMPGIDGYQTCTEIRKNSRYKKTPIIMVSGKSSPLDEVKGIIAGCTTYLIKPIQEEAFRKLSVRVLEWLNDHRDVNNTAAVC